MRRPADAGDTDVRRGTDAQEHEPAHAHARGLPIGYERGVSLHVALPRTKLLAQCWDSVVAVPASMGQSLIGEPWPTAVGAAGGKQVRVLCFSPVDWLVTADEAPQALLARLQAAIGEVGLTITDLSHGLGALEVRGPRSRELLSKACGLDFHPRVFPAGSCARTRLAQVAAILDAGADDESFTCYVASSYLDYLHRWLTDSVVEFASNP